MKPYPTYKPSGIDWLGDIPKHWEVKKLKYLAKIGNGQDHKKVWDDKGEHPIIGTGGRFGWANKFLHSGPSVILGRKGTIDKPQYVDRPFWAVDTAYYTSIDSTTDPKYFFYLCFTINFDLFKYGSAVPSMTQEVLNQIPFGIPQKEEQITIARFLDQKTAEIDHLIAQKQALIDKLEEEKQAVINQAVTKGLNPDAPMKDSGLPWVGEIPEHWELGRLKNVSRVRQGLQIPISERSLTKTDDAHEYITIKSINNLNEPKEYIKNPSSRVICREEDILMARTGATGIAITNVKGVFHNNFFLVDYDKEKVIKDYLYLFLRSQKIKEYLLLVAGTTTIPDLNHDAFYQTPLFYPLNKKEQRDVVDFIDSETKRINMVLGKVDSEVNLIKEYKTALISEAVTGKIDVRDHQKK